MSFADVTETEQNIAALLISALIVLVSDFFYLL